MNRVATYLFVVIMIAAFSFSCKHKVPVKQKVKPTFSTLRADNETKDRKSEKNEIFYGLLTPTEITTLFNRMGVPYEKAALNPITNNDLYTSNSKASINLGIYGVDFGYVKMFSISQQMIDYILTIKDMSNKLGIPDKYMMDPIKKIESDMSSPDTIMALVNSISLNSDPEQLRILQKAWDYKFARLLEAPKTRPGSGKAYSQIMYGSPEAMNFFVNVNKKI